MYRRLSERLPVPPEAVLAARDALRTARHSAAVTLSLFNAGLTGEETGPAKMSGGRHLPDDIAGVARGVASDLAHTLLPAPIAQMSGGRPWADLAACATRPDIGNACRFAPAARIALLRCFAVGPAARRVLISESRLYAGYSAAVDGQRTKGQDADFFARLIVRLYRSHVIVDIRGGERILNAEQSKAQAIFALGLFMAGSLENSQDDLEGQFESARDLSEAIGTEIWQAIGEEAAIRALLDQYREHL